MTLLHGTCIAIHGRGVILLGKSGSGKSDLALRLIDRCAQLVSDDQIELIPKGERLTAQAPARLHGLLEVRGVGIIKMPAWRRVTVAMVVQLREADQIERLPIVSSYCCEGVSLPSIALHAFHPSTPIKVEMALQSLRDGSMLTGAWVE